MKLKSVIKVKKLHEGLEVLNKYKERCKIIAGGTDIVIDLNHKTICPEVLLDITSIGEISQIEDLGDYITIGSGVTFTQMVENNLLDNRLIALSNAAKSVGSPQIRNLGTIGGNICNASPAADTVPSLLALDAIAIIVSIKGKREMPLEEFFLNKGETALNDNEMLHSVRFKKLRSNQGLGFSKLGLRKALAISRISTSIYVDIDEIDICKEIRIGSGALGRYAVREKEAEEFIKGKVLTEEKIEEYSQFLKRQIEKRLEGRSSKEFKSQAVMGTFKKAIREAIQIAKS